MDEKQKDEIAKLLNLLMIDVSWLAMQENQVDAAKRMTKIIMSIADALDGESVNAKQIAYLLYDDEISVGLLDDLNF